MMVSSSLLTGIEVTLRFESSIMNIFNKVFVDKQNLYHPQKFLVEAGVYFFVGRAVPSSETVYHLVALS